MITLKIPGKLYIIGEYSILKSGNEAVLVAIDKFVNLQIEAATDYEFSSEMGRFKWMMSEKMPVLMYDSLQHAKAAIYVAHMYLKYKKVIPSIYRITLESELTNQDHKKYGLGSSGAVIIAIIKGILRYHHVDFTELDLFKLSVLAQIEINDVTSGGELAASIYGGWVHYKRYDLVWVLNKKGQIDEFMESTWPQLKIEKLDHPKMELAICFSGLSMSTKTYTEKVLKLNNSPWYQNFLNKTYLVVTQFKEALIRNDYYTMKHMVKVYREMLQELENEAGIIIESEPFKKMIEIAESFGYLAKSSGAGFGDCGFAILNQIENKIDLFKAWEDAKLFPLEMKVWSYDE
ncbi:phosphomevalonate kinase [Acholeplasma hippikon]|uniref:phosphomevalonate kinase n=1 Tax=Acholeplasma hippikon TaxID=264636 RepID=A0A449BJ45_9MOLU|nr:phosphomevalonate kinase [Acholeplasma hippikon]VEU82491.1 mevalonate kinase [Acholeplasma hippikon]